MTDDELPGVWINPAGIRIEVKHEADGWRTYTYMTRRGGGPATVHEFENADQIRDAISRLEASGHVRQEAGVPPPAPLTSQITGQWMILGGIILIVVIVIFAVAA